MKRKSRVPRLLTGTTHSTTSWPRSRGSTRTGCSAWSGPKAPWPRLSRAFSRTPSGGPRGVGDRPLCGPPSGRAPVPSLVRRRLRAGSRPHRVKLGPQGRADRAEEPFWPRRVPLASPCVATSRPTASGEWTTRRRSSSAEPTAWRSARRRSPSVPGRSGPGLTSRQSACTSAAAPTRPSCRGANATAPQTYPPHSSTTVILDRYGQLLPGTEVRGEAIEASR